MKKLLLVLLLMCSLTAFTQKQQIIKDYYSAINISSEGIKGEWTEVNTRIIFNYDNQNNKVKVYLGNNPNNPNNPYSLTQLGVTTRGITRSGFGYAELILEDHLGERMYMQIFDDEEFGVRFIFKDSSIIQITN